MTARLARWVLAFAVPAGVFGSLASGPEASSTASAYAYDHAATSTTSIAAPRTETVRRYDPRAPLPRDRVRASGGFLAAKAEDDVGLSSRGLRPAAGMRVRPRYSEPVPELAGALCSLAAKRASARKGGECGRRRATAGRGIDATGNVLPSRFSPDAHIPLSQFKFRPDLFG